MTNDICRVPAERVDDATSVSDVRRHRVRAFRRRRCQPSLLVPGDVVLLCEFVSETPEVIEAEPRPAVEQENSRPAAGATARDERSVVVGRELGPTHRRRSSHAAAGIGERFTRTTVGS